MLALVMCLLVLVVAGVVLRDAMHHGTANRATAPPRAGRGRPPRREHRLRPVRSGAALVVSTAGIGVLLAVAIGLLAVGAGVLLRAATGE